MPMRDAAGVSRSPAETPTDTWVQGPAGRLRVSDGGSGPLPPVVLVHGLAGNVSYWTPQLDHLRRSRRAIALELRGHGASEPASDRDYSFDAFVSDLEAAVDALALPTFALVGHSLGAALVGEYAGRHPGRVTTLVLVDPPGDLTRLPPEAIEQVLGALRSERYSAAIEQQYEMGLAQGEPGVRERVLANLRVTPREVVVRAYETMVVDPVPPLERYRAAGGRAVAVLADGNAGPIALPELMPDLPRRSIRGTGHWLHMDRPAEFNRLLDELLADGERGEE
jgi:pimeloyl-ACP methyl ester carboxylesterase